MPVHANTNETYDLRVMREDLQEAYTMISPTDTPFQQAARHESASNTLFEWPVVELAATDANNRVVEGDDDPDIDVGTNAARISNYTQISDKVAKVSRTSQAVDAAAKNLEKLSEQVIIKMKEMKRDKEVMLLSNTPALPGSSGNARSTAGLPAFLRTNTLFQTGGADPTLSGGTEGYPNAGAVAGTTPVLFAEGDLNDLVEQCWNEGAAPTMVMVNSGNKRRVTESFIGNATRFEDNVSRKTTNAIEFYRSDFGADLTIVPNRFQPVNNPGAAAASQSYNVFILDPEYIAIAYLDEVKQKPLAETGHSMSTLIWCEYGLQIDNEKAHAVRRDTNNQIS